MVVRYTTPVEQGAKLNMELGVHALLFFSREAMRTASLRLDMGDAVPSGAKRDNLIYIFNTGWASFAFTTLLVAAAYIFGIPHLLASAEWATLSASLNIHLVVGLNLAGCMFEALAEPLFMATQCYFPVNKLRVDSEAFSLVIKTLVSSGLVMAGYPALLSIALSQAIYSGSLFAFFYVWYFRTGFKENPGVLPKVHKNTFIPTRVKAVFSQLYLESVMRLVLTEGEKILLSNVAVLSSQGVYEVVSNLGSVVTRLLFKFLEEVSLVIWSKLFAAGTVVQAERLLKLLLRVLIMIGYIFMCWGPAYSQTLLYVLYGAKWVVEAESLMSLYWVYVGLMGVNGVLEAFYRAAAKEADLQLLWRMQTAFSLTFVVVSLLLSHLGAGVHGIVLSSAFVMSLRIAFCLRFAARTLPSFAPATCLPSTPITLFAFTSFVLTKASQLLLHPTPDVITLKTSLVHVAFGAVLGIIFLALIYIKEKHVLRELKTILGR
eukprot:TRINITY_DN4322_c0_g1_i1.p2 TRINITY_DN4322_c0_g1~~TRINITY_DN4322_c0_g1_i1.p2  ORF type:complete len:538 (+),score=189.46 TRINITY_DN4322_c0_g1_i1:149-1615(+)